LQPLRLYLFKIFLLIFLINAALSAQKAVAQQVTVKGTVYNMSRTRPLEAVSVMSTSGRGTITDSNGNYNIIVNEGDSISFSYLGRTTVKFPVSNILIYPSFDVALHVEPTELKPLQVSPRNYFMDSLQNRKDYARVFDYQKPKLKLTDPGQGGLGVGLDLDAIIGMFQFNRNRRMLAFQKRLIQEEQDKFVDHRFTAYLVKKITHLSSPDLDTFMVKYRPSYYFTRTTTDYDFEQYIKLAGRDFENKKGRAGGELKKENNLQLAQQ
jgi:hypothetical protein